MDVISRQKAIDALCAACGKACDKSKFVYNAPQDEQVILCPEHYSLCTLPSAQPKRGKWIIYTVSPFDGADVKCSECGQRGCATYWDYCPNCGARMEGVHVD